MKILSLDTSGNTQSVALMEGEQLLASRHERVSQSHTEILIPTIQQLLEQLGWTLNDIELFALTHGPGSFTGLRIGISTLKGLVWGTQKPVVGVDTLQALAVSQLWQEKHPRGMPVLAVMDARMKEVYAGVYALGKAEGGAAAKTQGEIQTLLPPQVISVSDLLLNLAQLHNFSRGRPMCLPQANKGGHAGPPLPHNKENEVEELTILDQKGLVLGNAWQVYPELLEKSGWTLGSSQEQAHQVQAHQVQAHQVQAHQVQAHQVQAHQVQAQWVGRLAYQKFSQGEFIKAEQLKPQYLRLPAAEMSRKAS